MVKNVVEMRGISARLAPYNDLRKETVMATTRRGIALVSFVCFISVLASADSVSNIPITGTASQGFGQTTGNYNIQGPGLSLSQYMPGGPNSIGFCTAGSICDFSFAIPNSSVVCGLCLGQSFGSLGNKSATFLDSSLLLTGSALVPSSEGGSAQIVQLPITISGIITGYQLVNCFPPDVGLCDLGPKQFAVRIVGHGTGTFIVENFSGGVLNIFGGSATFTGTATVVPEPISLALTGTGLLGIWIRRKIGQSKRI